LSKDEIENLALDAKDYKAEDEAQRDLILAKYELQSYCVEIKGMIEYEYVGYVLRLMFYFLDEGQDLEC
jgi:hypothetical protein